jgi:hypothetical protein
MRPESKGLLSVRFSAFDQLFHPSSHAISVNKTLLALSLGNMQIQVVTTAVYPAQHEEYQRVIAFEVRN